MPPPGAAPRGSEGEKIMNGSSNGNGNNGIDVQALFQAAGDEGTLSPAGLQVLAITDLL